jgi:E3 ubiquitin-protein ligase BAH
MQDGVAVDASLTPSSRGFFERVAAELRAERTSLSSTHANAQPTSTPTPTPTPTPATTISSPDHEAMHPAANDGHDQYQTVEVPLTFDAEFFDMLQSDVNNLDVLQAEEGRKMTAEVLDLGRDVSLVCRTSRFSKSDLARWRHIFELYLDAEVFFSTNERDHGSRSSQKALKQLQWFQAEVEKGHLAKHFKLRESQTAFSRFVNLNLMLLKNLQFQELNKLAIIKILKSEYNRVNECV